jgi:hypothetical protein
MAPPRRNPRRAYDENGREIEPMTLGQMRVHGVRSISAECTACRHEARILVDMVPDRMPVTDVAVEHEALRACLSGAVCLMPI